MEPSTTPSPVAVVADDNDGVARLLGDVVAGLGLTMRRAASGPEALRMATEDGVKLLLLDVMLPGMDGYAVLARLRGDARARDLPVIVVTGERGAVHDEVSRAMGAGWVVRKPFDIDDVTRRVRAALGMPEPAEA